MTFEAFVGFYRSIYPNEKIGIVKEKTVLNLNHTSNLFYIISYFIENQVVWMPLVLNNILPIFK